MPKQNKSQIWFNTWWSFFKGRAHWVLSTAWHIIATFAVVVFLFYVSFIIYVLFHSRGGSFPTESIEQFNMVMSMLAAGLIFAISFIVFMILFFLSLTTKGRKCADAIFRYSEHTELEKYKIEVNNRLDKIETILKTLVENQITEQKLREIIKEEIIKHEIVKITRHAQIDEGAKQILKVDKLDTKTT